MLGVKENVSFHGNISDVNRVMSEADIYVHSALYEPFGIVFIEAMSTGLPIVTLDGKGNRDIIDHGVNGFMVADSAVDVFSRHIIDLLNDDSLYQKISRNAIATSKIYDIKNVANTYARYYSDLLVVNKR
jgi:glycosyltransferase EpsD